MKAVKTIILILVSSIVFGQDITFSTKEEVVEAVDYLNKLRHSKEFVKSETGVTLKKNIKRPLIIDSTLCELAKLRVIEMIEKNDVGHNTKYDTEYYAECCAFNYENSIKAHIIQYVIDDGVPSLGHRKNLVINYGYKNIGIALGVTPSGKSFSCILTFDGISEALISLK